MKVTLLCLSLFVIALGKEEPYYVPYNYYDLWTVVGRNSSGQLYFNPTADSRRVFIWKPHNASIPPSLFFEDYPKVLQDDLPTTSPGIPEGTISPSVYITSPATPKEIKETLPTTRPSGHLSADIPAASALELPPPEKGNPRMLLQVHQHTLQEDVDETVLGVHENQRHFEKEGTIVSIGSQMECSVMTHNLGLKGFKVM